MRYALARRRVPTGGTSPTFLNTTDWARPTFPASQQVFFTTKAQLDAAVTGMQPGDWIRYSASSTSYVAPTSPLSISSSTTTPAYKISGKNIASPGVVIDFGCSKNMWDPSTVSTGYVAFSNTASSQTSAFVVSNCSGLSIYGGDYTCTHGYGIEIDGPAHDLRMWDQYVHHVGGSGLWVRDYVSSVVTFVRNSDFRMEVNRFCLDPSLDSHPDKGTGHHGMILHGNTGETSGNTFTCYAHDPLLPGETSFGTVWPEGSGGSVIEAGHNTGNGYQNNTYYAFGERLLMKPNGTNPGSGGSQQAGGNILEFWGSDPLTDNVVGWVEGSNCTGGCVHGVSGGWNSWPSGHQIVVQHGRATNMNQFTSTSSQGGANAVPYNLSLGITYQDCTIT